jgi:hypothetical protein
MKPSYGEAGPPRHTKSPKTARFRGNETASGDKNENLQLYFLSHRGSDNSRLIITRCQMAPVVVPISNISNSVGPRARVQRYHFLEVGLDRGPGLKSVESSTSGVSQRTSG